MLGRDFEVEVWSRFVFDLIGHFGKMNSTLGSVVPLAIFFLQISTNYLRCDSCCRSWPGGWWSSRGCTACSSHNISSSKIDTTSKTIVNILERSTIARSSGGKSRRKMPSWKTSSVDLEFIENKTLGCQIMLHGGGA